MLIKLRFRFSEVFFGVLLAVAIFAMGMTFSSTIFPPNQTSEREGSTNNSKEKSPKIGDTESADDRIAKYTLWLAILTGALVVVSGFQGYFLIRADRTARITADATGKMAEAVNIQARVAKATHAANVGVQTPKFSLARTTAGELVGLRFWVTFENTGNSATQNMFGQIALGVVLNPQDFSYGAVAIPGPNPQPMVAGARAQINSGENPINAQQAIAIRNGTAHCFMAGWVEYDDMFPDTMRHRVEYCFQVTLEGDIENGHCIAHFELVGPHNRHYDVPRSA